MSQIVFEGDKLPFQCRASVVDPDTKMYWLRYGQVVETNRSTGIFVLSSHVADNTVMMHSLVLEDLKSTQKGVWECMVSTPQVGFRADDYKCGNELFSYLVIRSIIISSTKSYLTTIFWPQL